MRFFAPYAIGQIPGSPTLAAAAAGNIGEVLATLVEQASAVSLTSGAALSVCSLSITPGEWEISGYIAFLTGTATTMGQLEASYSPTDNVQGATDVSNLCSADPNPGGLTGAVQVVQTPIRRFATSTTTIRYLVAKATFGVSTLKAFGKIQVRRVS